MKNLLFFCALFTCSMSLLSQGFIEDGDISIGMLRIVTADFNGDQLPDALGPDLGFFGPPVSLNLALNTGEDDISFNLISDFPFVDPRGIPAAADFDNDGDIDIITTDASQENTIFLINDGQANFTVDTIDTPNSRFMYAADFNNDGLADFIGHGGGNGGLMYVYINQGNNDYERSSFHSAGTSIRDLIIEDIDNDGDLDLVFAEGSISGTPVYVYVNIGDGTLALTTSFSLFDAPENLALADMNDDGRIDIVLATVFDIFIYLQNSNGSYSESNLINANLQTIRTVAAADFNQDGRMDLVVGLNNNGIKWLRQKPGDNLMFDQLNAGTIQPVPWLVVEDLDNDGDLDFLASSTDLYWYENFTQDLPSSTSDIQKKQLTVFPNPANNQVFIPALSQTDATAHLYDQSGKILQSINVIDGKIAIDHLPASSYVIKFHGDDGILKTARFIKTN